MDFGEVVAYRALDDLDRARDSLLVGEARRFGKLVQQRLLLPARRRASLDASSASASAIFCMKFFAEGSFSSGLAGIVHLLRVLLKPIRNQAFDLAQIGFLAEHLGSLTS